MTTTPVTAASSNNILNNYIAQQNSSAASGTSGTSSSSSTSSVSGLGGNLNTFLKILTTQLQNQDPTAATDTNQFTAELVQFAQAEQQINTNTDLTTLINLQKSSSGVTAALGYIGKYAEAPTTNQINLQKGASEMAYNLPSAASNVTINVTDAAGNSVGTFSGPTAAGLNYITWNGIGSNGTQLADGTYKFSLSATDSGGNTLNVTDMRSVGLVTGVISNSDGTTSLQMGSGMSVTSSTIDAVYESGNLPTGTAV